MRSSLSLKNIFKRKSNWPKIFTDRPVVFRLRIAPEEEMDLIRDPIYGFIEVPRVIRPLLDAPEVQRLRWVSQLPLEQMVYPSAQHSRFEHSLGVMYLSMIVANTLLVDPISRKRIEQGLKEDGDLMEGWEQYFVLCAGIVGLLHDVGHAPFSHTFEEALRGLPQEDFSFHHETLGFVLASRLLREYTPQIKGTHDEKTWSIFKDFTLNALNKEKTITEIPSLAKILRSIVDGPIDTDKGDYLLRDAYHCGVPYGKYDVERLWRFVRLSSDFTLGVHPKGAIEAWTLRFARYKMFQNVYWHHVRDITDALLVDALQLAFKASEKNAIPDLCPIHLPLRSNATLTDDEIHFFLLWTDTSLFRVLERISKNRDLTKTLAEENRRKMMEILDWIPKRDLPKRLFKYPSSISIPMERDRIKPYHNQIYGEVQRVLEQYTPARDPRTWIVYHEIQPFPLLDSDTLLIHVIPDSGEEIPLPGFLGFFSQLSQGKEEPKPTPEDFAESYGTEIRIFSKERPSQHLSYKELRQAVLSVIQRSIPQ
jgi:HD superfamily phosphohydrolase